MGSVGYFRISCLPGHHTTSGLVIIRFFAKRRRVSEKVMQEVSQLRSTNEFIPICFPQKALQLRLVGFTLSSKFTT